MQYFGRRTTTDIIILYMQACLIILYYLLLLASCMHDCGVPDHVLRLSHIVYILVQSWTHLVLSVINNYQTTPAFTITNTRSSTILQCVHCHCYKERRLRQSLGLYQKNICQCQWWFVRLICQVTDIAWRGDYIAPQSTEAKSKLKPSQT